MSSLGQAFDVAIVGAGHNGLVCGTLLARAGLRVAVFEQSARPGGFAAGAERLVHGVDVGEAALDFGLLRQDVIDDLGLEREGLQLTSARALVAWGDLSDLGWIGPAGDRGGVRDSSRFAAWLADLGRRSAALETLLRRRCDRTVYGELMRSPELLRWLSASADDLLADAGLSDHARSALGAVACLWSDAGASDQGTGLSLLLQLAGSNPQAGTAQLRPVRRCAQAGGLAAVLQSSFRQAGGELYLETPVVAIRGQEGAVSGVTVEQAGRAQEVEARWVLSAIDAQQTLCRLLTTGLLRVDVQRAAGHVLCRNRVARWVLSLSRELAPTLEQVFDTRWLPQGARPQVLQSSVDALRLGDSADDPWLEVFAHPAEAGRAVLVVHGHGVREGACGGVEFEQRTSRVASRLAEALAVDPAALAEHPDHRRVASVWQNALSIRGGDGFQGVMSLEQMFALRPLAWEDPQRDVMSPGADGDAGVERLLFCGSAAHPGGYVTGLPGRVAAQRVLHAERLDEGGA